MKGPLKQPRVWGVGVPGASGARSFDASIKKRSAGTVTLYSRNRCRALMYFHVPNGDIDVPTKISTNPLLPILFCATFAARGPLSLLVSSALAQTVGHTRRCTTCGTPVPVPTAPCNHVMQLRRHSFCADSSLYRCCRSLLVGPGLWRPVWRSSLGRAFSREIC